jgi:hypothetical protein
MPVETLISLVTESLLFKVLANWPLFLYVFMEKCTRVSVTARTSQPKCANFQFVLSFIMSIIDGSMDFEDFFNTFLLKVM